MEPLVSIVIPVYKTEKYLVDSVNSILNQTYKNLEIILVDDGSPDSCPAICDEIASKDERVQVIHKENGGLSSARNAGIDASTGEYILFFDSDDNLENFAIKDAVEIILDEESDAVYPNSYVKVIESTGEKTVCKHFREEDFDSDPKIFGLNILIGKGRAKRAHSVLYRNSVIKENNVRFLIGKISEDYFFNVDFLSVANKISIYLKPSLNYLKRNGSLSTSYFENFFETVLEMDDYALAFVEKLKGTRYEEQIAGQRESLLYRNLLIYSINVMGDKKTSYKERKRKCRALFENERFQDALKTSISMPFFEGKRKRQYFEVSLWFIKRKMYGITCLLAYIASIVNAV